MSNSSTPSQPNIQFTTPEQAKLTNIMWSGKTIEYNVRTKTTRNAPELNDDKGYTQRNCGDGVGPVLNDYCQKVVQEAAGATVYAFRYRVRVPLKGVALNPQSYLRAQNLDVNDSSMTFKQVLYTYSTGSSYKPWFFYDQSGTRVELSQNGQNLKYFVSSKD